MYPNGGSLLLGNSITGARQTTLHPAGVTVLTSGGGSGDVYRRLQDSEADDRSISSTSNETDADEYHSLIDETYKKSSKAYDQNGGRLSGGRPIPSTGGNNCSRNRVFLYAIGLFSFVTLLLMNLPLGNEKGRVGTIVGWSANTSRQTVNYVLPSENTTIIDPLNICTAEERTGDGNENEKVFLLIVVCSSAKNFEARQVIRETWGNVSEFNYPEFARMHAPFRGEYLEPRSAKHLQDYMKRGLAGDGTTVDEEQQSAVPVSVRSINEAGSTIRVEAKNNKSSQNASDTVPTPPQQVLDGQNFNVKVVFLLGQSESDYLHQRRKFLHSDHTTDSQQQQQQQQHQTVPTRPEHSHGLRTPAVSLFAAGSDVDPAFNVRDEELDELQMRIINESEVYGDIIQESFIDSYNNLTLKTIMMLKWVTNNCDGRVKYIMKCDDDTFVNVPNLVQVLLGGTVPLYKGSIPFYDRNTVVVKSQKNRLVEVKRLLTGFLFCEVKPIGDTSSKWYSPNYMYSKEFYPNYLSGTAYLMNLDAAKLLYRTSLTTPIFHLEDVYLTGIVADRVKLRRYHHPLFFYSFTKDLCALRGMISQHQLQPSDIRSAYDFVTNGTIACSGPERNFSMAKMKLQVRKKCK